MNLPAYTPTPPTLRHVRNVIDVALRRENILAIDLDVAAKALHQWMTIGRVEHRQLDAYDREYAKECARREANGEPVFGGALFSLTALQRDVQQLLKSIETARLCAFIPEEEVALAACRAKLPVEVNSNTVSILRMVIAGVLVRGQNAESKNSKPYLDALGIDIEDIIHAMNS